mmetsp:Transcript_9537/g.23486  ORF Transcript_9537/g.23486 Transcript_9537/m.23486 type:complete len:206 (+) Transcript_9537:977-1594(+)
MQAGVISLLGLARSFTPSISQSMPSKPPKPNSGWATSLAFQSSKKDHHSSVEKDVSGCCASQPPTEMRWLVCNPLSLSSFATRATHSVSIWNPNVCLPPASFFRLMNDQITTLTPLTASWRITSLSHLVAYPAISFPSGRERWMGLWLAADVAPRAAGARERRRRRRERRSRRWTPAAAVVRGGAIRVRRRPACVCLLQYCSVMI